MKETLDEKVTLTQKSIDLPRNGVIREIALLFNVTLANASASAVDVTMEEILKAIEEIRVVADANDVKYALNGLDVAIMNYYDSASKSVKISDSVTVPASGTASKSFLLFLRGGELGVIHAVAKESLKLYVNFASEVKSDVTFQSAEVTVTLDKLVFKDVYEWFDYFAGVLIEPKVWSKEKSFETLNELSEVLDIPTGAIAWRGFLVAFNDSNARADIIDKYAIIQTQPQRTELFKIDWSTAKELDKIEYKLDSTLTGVTILDYNQEFMEGGFDLRDAKTGVFKLALKTSASGKIRYISHELVVLE